MATPASKTFVVSKNLLKFEDYLYEKEKHHTYIYHFLNKAFVKISEGTFY